MLTAFRNVDDFELISIQLKDRCIPAIYSNLRISSKTIPEGVFKYDIRHNSSGDMCSIAPFILVNHLGVIISSEDIIDRNAIGEPIETTLSNESVDFSVDPDLPGIPEFLDKLGMTMDAVGRIHFKEETNAKK